MLLRDVHLLDDRRTDVWVDGGRVAELGSDLDVRGADVLDAAGGLLLPGLHDHHCHVLAMAAARVSVSCGPPVVRDRAGLFAALQAARPHAGWVRGVDYHESVAGPLDREVLDDARSDLPARVQHRGGSLWTLNSVALGVVLRAGDDLPDGVERDGAGRPTGRLWRLDDWLRSRLPAAPPDLAGVSAELSRYGVCGVTDATPALTLSAVALLRDPVLKQRITLLGDPDSFGPVKIVVSDHALPTLDQLTSVVREARPRPVAVHCVTRAAMALTLAALTDVGTRTGDRIEHAAVAPPELVTRLRDLGLTVVTQPSLPARRGDEYLAEVEPDDLTNLWPFASLLAAGVPVGCSSDAPYGDPDPWASIRAAVHRRAPSGRPVAGHERVDARTALRGFLTDAIDPGGAERQVRVGVPADLVLLDAPPRDVLNDPRHERVRLTMIGGAVSYRA